MAAGRTQAIVLCLLFCLASASANTTYCWGSGTSGTLGDGRGASGPYAWPLPTAVIDAPEFAFVSSGVKHTCALTAAGGAYCWGDNWNGQLGTGDDTSSAQTTPAAVATQLVFSVLDAGKDFTCGIAGDRAYCWGAGSSGQLGSGSNASSTVPLGVAGGHSFSSITLGMSHACALTPEGQAWCWGDGTFGQLGSQTSSAATPIAVLGGLNFSALAAGDQHTCGIARGSGAVYCWGNNADGQLGSNGITMSSLPQPVAGEHMFAAITAGSMFTCGISSEYGSAAYCWGSDSRGQLGLGGSEGQRSNEPLPVVGKNELVAITAGGAHTCAIDRVATAWCWGEGEQGQLGTGKKGRVSTYEEYGSTIPVTVSGDLPFYSISAGAAHTCGISPKAATPASPAAPLPASPAAVSPAQPQSPATQPESPMVESPAPQSPAPTTSTSSSSVPIGAIVGGVAGGIAVVAVVGFVVQRLKRGWPRREAAVLPVVADKSPAGSLGPTAPGSSMVDSMSTFKGSSTSPGTPLPPCALPLSYISSTGSGRTSGEASRPFNPSSDPTLQYIASYVASRLPSSAPAAHSAHPTSVASHGSGGSGGSREQQLSPDTAMWLVQWGDLEIQDAVGRGSFGCVYRATWQETTVAVKVLFTQGTAQQANTLELPDATMHELQAEAAVMIRMRHPNIVQFMGLCLLPPALITEYCARGSLFDCLRAANTDPAIAAQLTWQRRLAMAVDAATGLVYLHGRNIVHRDVKSPNYLVDEHWRVKASDFNLSRLLEGEGARASSGGGATNPNWLAPELLRGGRATAACDVFSFGVVLWELMTWRMPWAGSGLSPFQVGAKVVRGGRLDIPPKQALPGPAGDDFERLDDYCQLVRDCWAQAPADRPSMASVVRRLRALLTAAPSQAPPAS